jgi:hypothetical protein
MSATKKAARAALVAGLKTPELCRRLGVPHGRLANHIRNGKITPLPAKDSSGDYVWTPEDVKRARKALALDLRHTRSGRRRELG